jgi:putative oxidoreductase
MLRIFSLILARCFISFIFLLAGIEKLFNWHETEKMLMTALSDWQGHLGGIQLVQDGFTFLVSQSAVLLVVATLFELLGALMILVGVRERMGAFLLILFLVPTTLLFHAFWFLEEPARELQSIMFLKNISILGGLIVVSIHGARMKPKEESPSFTGFG